MAFLQQEIMGVDGVIPGVFPDAAVPAPGGLPSAGINSFALDPPSQRNIRGNGLDALAASLNYGQFPNVVVNATEVSNDTISYSYVVLPWEDSSETRIVKKMLVFINRHQDKVVNAVHMASLAKMNVMMREMYDMFQRNASTEFSDPNSLQFQQLLQTYGERGLNRFQSALMKYNHNLSLVERDLGEDFADLKIMYRLANESISCYMTKVGILNRWNYVGGVISMSHVASRRDIDFYQMTEHTLNVGVAFGKEITLSAIWRRLENGDRLFLILKPVTSHNNSKRPFQFVPYACKDGGYPPIRELQYRDYNGQWTMAYVLNIGKVNGARPLQGQDNDEHARTQASGLNATLEQAFAAKEVLEDFTAELGV
jgi:hypothetical protein